MTGHGVGSERALAHTSIIEDITKIRNQKHDQRLQRSAVAEADALGAVPDDLGLDAPLAPKRMRSSLAVALPDVIEIQAPAVEGVEALPMLVLKGASKQALWVELTTANVDYLCACVSAHIAKGDVKQPAPGQQRPVDEKVAAPAAGVVWAVDRCAFRARFIENGKPKSKDFRPTSSDASDIKQAATAAVLFVASDGE